MVIYFLVVFFRPCAMVVPDFELICEIMLVAEGFVEARGLARKFITLYSLCKELLSKQVGLWLSKAQIVFSNLSLMVKKLILQVTVRVSIVSLVIWYGFFPN